MKPCPDCLGCGYNLENDRELFCLTCDGRGKVPTTREENSI